MASITLGGNPIHTSGELPKVGTKLADFKLVKMTFHCFGK
jgi:thiol peroxidase